MLSHSLAISFASATRAGSSVVISVNSSFFLSFAETPPPGDYRRTHLISLIDSVRDKIVAKGILESLRSTSTAKLCSSISPIRQRL